MKLRPTKKRAYGEEAGNEDQPSSPRKGSTAKKNKKGTAGMKRSQKQQAEAMRGTERKHVPEPHIDPMHVDTEFPPREQQGSASPKVPPPRQASHSHESDDQSDAQDSDDEGADMAEELAGDDVAFDRGSVMKSFVKALHANGATEDDVTTCLGALPTTTPTVTPISVILIAAYAAFWAMTGGLGVPSLVWAMVGCLPLMQGVVYYSQVVYCMHFPVDYHHMMGAGSETRWGFKNLRGRFVDSDNKIVKTVCCTGYFLLLLMEYLPFKYVPIIDLFPFVNRARGGGFSPGNPLHVTALLTKINMWLANGARIFRIGSRTVVLGALSVFEGLKADGCKHFDVKVDVGRQKVRVHVFTRIKREDGSTTPVFLIGSQHLCMFRMPWLALYIIACEIFLFCLLNVGVSTSKLQKLYRSVKNCGLTDEEQHQQFELLLSEMEPADRAEVEALQRDKGKTLLQAYNSWKSSTTANRCVRPGCLCTRPGACVCDNDHPHTQHGQLQGANTGFDYSTRPAAALAAHILDNLPDKDPKLSIRVDAKNPTKVVVVLDAGTRKRLKTAEKIFICDAVAKHAPGSKSGGAYYMKNDDGDVVFDAEAPSKKGNTQTGQSKLITDARARGEKFVMMGEKRVSTETKTQGDGGTVSWTGKTRGKVVSEFTPMLDEAADAWHHASESGDNDAIEAALDHSSAIVEEMHAVERARERQGKGGNQQTVQSQAIVDGRTQGLDFVMVGKKKVSTKTKTQGDGAKAKKSLAEDRVKALGGANAEVFDVDGILLGKIFDGRLLGGGAAGAYKTVVVEGNSTRVCRINSLRRGDELRSPAVV